MDILPSSNIFRELQVVHDTGYFSAQPSLEDRWQQVRACLCVSVLVKTVSHLFINLRLVDHTTQLDRLVMPLGESFDK